MSRYVNFVTNIGEIGEAFTIIKRIREDLSSLVPYYFAEESEIGIKVHQGIERIDALLLKHGNPYMLSSQINHELLSAENVEYAMTHKKYPEQASPTNDLLVKEMQEIFEIEDYFHSVVSEIWKNTITDFEQFRNGDDFAFVGHSTGGAGAFLPGTQGHRNTAYNNIVYMSCSLFTHELMDMYNAKVALILDVDKDSFICASDFDCATRETDWPRSVKTVKVMGDRAVLSGYTSSEKVVSRITPPQPILDKNLATCVQENGEILNYDNRKVYNEVVLDKTRARPRGILMVTNGCDLVIEEYLAAVKMRERYNCKIKIANKSTYRKKAGLTPYTARELSLLEHQTAALINPANKIYHFLSSEEISDLVDDYIEEVVMVAGYEETVKDMIIDAVMQMKEVSRKRAL